MIMPHKIPGKTWETIGATVFTFNNNHFLCVVHYHSKFPKVKQVEELSAEHLIRCCKIIFAKYKLLSKMVSDTGIKFISEKFIEFCRYQKIKYAISSYTYQSNELEETCIKVVKRMMKKCF